MDAQILLVFRVGAHGQGRLAADILEGKPDRFMGELCFEQTIDFEQAAKLFGGEFKYPEDLGRHGFRTDQNVEGRAEVWYRLSDGSFGMAVCFTEDWRGRYGAGNFGVESITGRVEYLGKENGTYLFGLNGKFILGKYRAEMALALSSGNAGFPAVLSLKAARIEEDISLPEFIDSISGTDSYETIPVPDDYIKPEKAFGLNGTLNLTERTFLLTGSYRMKPETEASIAIGFCTQASDPSDTDGQAADRMSGGPAREYARQDPKYIWWIGAQLKNFTLSDISSALEGVDRFLALDNVSAAVVLANAEQEIPLSEKEGFFLAEIGTVHAGLTFQIEVRFCSGYLKEVLEIKEDCRISGYIPKDKEQAVVLSGHVKELVFLKFLILTEIDIALQKNAKQQFFMFSGAGNLKLDFPDLPLPCIHAKLSFEENQAGSRVTLSGQVGEAVENPLGIPHTRLEQVVFTAVSESLKQENAVEKREWIYFQGKAAVGEIEAAAVVYFVKETPAVVELMIGEGQRLSISGLVRQYCDFKWPELLDIQLYNGRLWYCSKDTVIGQTEYQKGFHAQLDTKIFFLPEFTLSVDIGQGKELKAQARLKEAARLAFLKLYTKQEGREYGPQVTIWTAKDKKYFTAAACVTIFSIEMGEVQIAVNRDRMEGVFCFPDDLPITGQVRFYIDENGLSLGKCGIGKLPKMDFDLPEMEFGNGKCKVRALDGISFKTVPEVKSKKFEMNESGLAAAFDLTVRIKTESAFSGEGGADFVALSFKDLKLSADKETFHEFTFDTFLKLLEKNIADLVLQTAEQIITGQVFDDVLTEEGMKNIVKFLSIAGLTWVINEVADYLICEGLQTVLAETFVAALTGVQESVWSGLGYTLILGGVLGVQGAAGTYTVERKAPKENTENRKKNPQASEAPTVFFQDEKLIIRWNDCRGAQGYSPVVVRKHSGRPEIDLVTGNSSCPAWEIAGSDEESLYLASYGFEYHIRIYAWNNEGSALGEETSIYLPKRPANLRVRYLCEKRRLCLTWDFVERAEQYEVERLWHEQGGTRQEIVAYGPRVKEAVYENQEPDQAIEVSVRGKTADVSGPAAASGRFYLYDLKPPEKIDGYDTDDGIVLEWAQVPYADRYRISCLDNAGQEIEVSMCRETRTVIEADKLEENVCYRLRIQPMNEEIEGWISEEVQVLWRFLPVPKIQELVCGGDGVMTVVLVSDDVRYRQMIYPDGRTAALDEQVLPCEWEIDGEAKVRLVDRARHGKWSEPISLQPVQPPEGAEAFIKEDILHVRWNETGTACLYGIEIVTGNDRRVEEMLTAASWQTDISQVPPEESIRVCLYAIDGADTRRRSVSVEIGLRY